MSFISFEQWLKISEAENFPKNKWETTDKEEFGDDLISLVQTAYKNAPKGSFINTKKDIVESDWLSIDFDEYPDLDATIFYRKPRTNETWDGIKIQGIGHDGSREAINVLLNKLKHILNESGVWVEASDALEHVMYKMDVPYADEETAKKVFPNSDLKFVGDRGKYTRTLNKETTITETIFGKPIVMKSESLKEDYPQGHREMSKEEHDAWEDLYAEGVTVLYPGGFKPMTGGHIDLIERYANHQFVKEVLVLVGPGVRNGITQEMAVSIAKELLEGKKKVKVEAVQYPSPLLTAYKFIDTAKPGNYALAASSKGEDYQRVHDFTQQHQPGGKYPCPEGVKVIELPLNVEPLTYRGRDDEKEGQPISASTLRADVMKKDYDNFTTNYPGYSSDDIEYVWKELLGKVKEDQPKPAKPSKKSKVKESLNEDTVTPSVNKHMTHAEDLVILGGPEGLVWVNKMLNSLFNDLRGVTPEEKVTLSVKIDGAPAIFAWSSFPGLKQPGISMKGLFAKEPKVFYTQEEIASSFSDKPELERKLSIFLKYLPLLKIPKGQIWQGDFLFSDESLKEAEIEGEKYYAFHPNTIYYVVPQDSELGQKISQAKVGVVWHTRYTGKDLENVKANYNAKIDELEESSEIFMTDPYIRSFAGLLNFTKEESEEIETKLKELKKLSATLIAMNSYKELIGNKDLVALFSIFQNSMIKSNIKIENPEGMWGEFTEFIQNRFAKEASTKKTEKGKEQTYRRGAELVDTVEQDKETFTLMMKIIALTTDLKSTLINKLNKVGSFQTYLKMKGDQLRKTNQEGFAVSDMHGSVVKLVDRSEFSFSNFSPEVLKGWEK